MGLTNSKLANKWFSKTVFLLASAGAAMTLFSSCGSSSSGSTVAAVPYNAYGTTSGVAGFTGFTGAYGSSGATVLGSAVGDMVYGGQTALEVQLVFGYAGGGAIAQGTLIVAESIPQCGIAAGTYQVQTATPGQFTDNTGENYEGIQMIAIGPTQIPLILIQAGIAPANPSVYNGSTAMRIQGSFAVGTGGCLQRVAY